MRLSVEEKVMKDAKEFADLFKHKLCNQFSLGYLSDSKLVELQKTLEEFFIRAHKCGWQDACNEILAQSTNNNNRRN